MIFTPEKNLIVHSHAIFFTEEAIKRIIISEHLLIDATFTYPNTFYETIIIMFYDPLILKMLPGIFISINNKSLNGYTECFKYIKNYINNYINSDLKKIKWKTFTTDFEISLFTAFKNEFSYIKDLKHLGCFFHYLKNIRKYLMKHGFTTNENQENYNYIINKCYEIPFINNIEKKIDKEIEKICKINNIYNNFLNYFKNFWSPYFKDKILNLREIDIKFRTTNSLENFNRIIKNEFYKKGKIEFVYYVDILINIANDQLMFFKEEINKIPKALKNKKNSNKFNEEKEKNKILKEIEELDEVITYNDSVKKLRI